MLGDDIDVSQYLGQPVLTKISDNELNFCDL